MAGRRIIATVALAGLVVLSPSASAADPAPELDGAALGLGWVLPFAGNLISTALLPVVVPRFRHRHFGGLTYIGNAPNFMVKSMCEEHGVRMPSFFGYML